MNISCSAEPCPIILDCSCVFYSGANLIYTGIVTNDTLCAALVKIDDKFKDAGLGYAFNNGIIQTAPGQIVKLGGKLIENTVINSGIFAFSFTGTFEASALITTGGTNLQFVKGDGSLDSNTYQLAGSYISALTGDGTATGPGSALFTLSPTGVIANTYGSSTTVPIITVDAKGRVTNITNTAIVFPPQLLLFSGDVTGAGVTGANVTLTLLTVNPNVYASNTFLKFAVNGKGLVTSAAPITHLDIEAVLGYIPVPNTRTITINGVTQDLTVNRSWTIAAGTGTVTSVGVSPGTGISASVANPTTTPIITITNTLPDRIVSLSNGTGISVTGSYPNFTITNTGLLAVTANNGLTANTTSNVQLGGTLIQNTTINGNLNTLTLLNDLQPPNTPFRIVNNYASTNASCLTLEAPTGGGLLITAGNTGVSAQAVNGIGVSALSTNGIGIVGTSLTFVAADFTSFYNSNTTVESVIRLTRRPVYPLTSQNGIGAGIEFELPDNNGYIYTAGKLGIRYNNNTNKNSDFEVSLVKNNVLFRGLLLNSEGSLKLDKYGLGTKTGTAAYTLQVDASGNVIEGSVTTGGISAVTATLPLTSTGGTTPDISTSMATNKLIGRGSSGTGVFEEITLGTGLSFSGTTLNATASVTPAALTKTDDTNVTLTLGGSPSTALLQATSLTLGWTGTLADSRIASASTWNAKVGGSGTINYVSKWSSSSALTDSQIFDDGTSVGIGTASPYAINKLQVSGIIATTSGINLDVTANTKTGIYSGANTMTFWAGNNQLATYRLNGNITGSYFEHTAGFTNNGSTPSGNQNTWRLAGAVTATTATNAINTTQLLIDPGYTQSTFGTGTLRGIYYNPGIGSLNTSTHVAFENTTGDVLLGTTSGSVGIGISTPAYKLDVNGTIYTNTNIKIKNSALTDYIGIDTFGAAGGVGNIIKVNDSTSSPATNYFFLKANSNNYRGFEMSYIEGAKKWGILGSLYTGLAIYAGTGSGTNEVARFSDATGNLLLGLTTDAGYKLDVNGTFHTTGQNTLSNLATGAGIGNKVVTANSTGVLVNDDLVTNFVKYGDILTQLNYAGRTVFISPVAMNGALFSTGFGTTTQAQWTITDVSSGGTLNAKTRTYQWKNRYNIIASFTGSTSGTTLTTVGSPALFAGCWIRLTDGTETGLGQVTGGSGNTWTLSVSTTQASQTMKAIYGSRNVYSAGNMYFGFWSAGYPGSITATFKVENPTTGTITTSVSTSVGTNISVNLAGGATYWKVPITPYNYVTDIIISFVDDGVHYINYQTHEMVVNYPEGIDIIPYINKDGGKMYGTLSFVNNPDGLSTSTKGSITNAGALTMATGTFTALPTSTTNTEMVSINSTTGVLSKQTIPSGGGGTVTSVDLSMPSAFTVSNNPVTTSGTLTVTGAGTSAQYVKGDGSLGTTVTKTSELTNDGDNGYTHFISLEDLPSNLTLYATNVASGISTYTKAVSSLTDPDFNTVAVNIPVGPLTSTTVATYCGGIVSSANIINGNPGIFTMSTIGSIRRTIGTAEGVFYYEIYKRDSGGIETLITTSANTFPVSSAVYVEFNAAALFNNGVFTATDRIVIKFYGLRLTGGSDPSFQFQFGGIAPVRTTLPIPLAVTPVPREIQSISTATAAGSIYGIDYIYLVSGTTTLTLPTAVGSVSKYTIKRVGTGVVSIATTSSQTIDGSSSPITINVQYVSIDLISDGTNWNII